MRYLKNSSVFFITLLLIVSIIYISLCINTNSILLSMQTDNLDFILPFTILVIIFYNFKYLKVKEEAINVLSLPLSKFKIFTLRYFYSIIQITLLYLILLIISLFVFIISNSSFTGNLNYYYLSLFIKYIVLILLFNFFLFFFTKGYKLIDSVCYIVIATFFLSIVNFLLLRTTDVFSNHYMTLNILVAPFNVLRCINSLIYKLLNLYEFGNKYIYKIIVVILFSIISITTIPLNFIEAKKFKLEKVEQHTNNLLYQIFTFILSLSSIFIISFLINTFASAFSFIVIVNTLLYLMYSTIIGRYAPTDKEKIVYFLIFLLAVVVPQII